MMDGKDASPKKRLLVNCQLLYLILTIMFINGMSLDVIFKHKAVIFLAVLIILISKDTCCFAKPVHAILILLLLDVSPQRK